MRKRHLWAAGTLLTTALALVSLLALESAPWPPDAAAVLGSSLLIWAAIAVVATLVEHSRLGYGLGVGSLVLGAAIALFHDISPLWWVAVASLAAAAYFWSDPGLGGFLRRRTSAAPVPGRAVALSLILLTLPGLTALTLTTSAGWLAALTLADVLLLVTYARRLPFGLLAIRTMPALLAIGAATIPSPGRWLWAAGQVAALALAWTQDVRLAVRPLVERGTRVMIPPELAPEEIRQLYEGKG